MIKRIELKGPARKMIADHFHVKSSALSLALNYRRNGLKDVQMREMALQHGGEYVVGVSLDRTVKVLDSKGEVVKIINQ